MTGRRKKRERRVKVDDEREENGMMKECELNRKGNVKKKK